MPAVEKHTSALAIHQVVEGECYNILHSALESKIISDVDIASNANFGPKFQAEVLLGIKALFYISSDSEQVRVETVNEFERQCSAPSIESKLFYGTRGRPSYMSCKRNKNAKD